MTLTPQGYRHRLVEKDIDRSLRSFGVVCITGPKYSGKTWVGLSRSNSAFILGDVDEYGASNKELAETSIRLALDEETPHLIDEWQEIPQILDSVRSEVDRTHTKGSFILTSSSTPKDRTPVHSGTGRIRYVRMGTMSLYESGDSSGDVSLSSIMNGDDIDATCNDVSLESLVGHVIGGGWPGNLDMTPEERRIAVSGYLDSMIADACSMDGVRRKESSFRMVIRSLARNECTRASLSKIHTDTGVPMDGGQPLILDGSGSSRPGLSYDTIADYIDVLRRLYLIEDQPAFDPNLKSSVRVGMTAKRHFTDPSLAAAALGAGQERLMKDLVTFGYLFESLCERDLRIYAESIGAKLFHYRDSTGMEVDAIIEMDDGTWGAFEIRLGAGKIRQAAESLLRFRDAMERRGASSMPSVLCVICGLTDRAYRRDDGVYVVPITALRP